MEVGCRERCKAFESNNLSKLRLELVNPVFFPFISRRVGPEEHHGLLLILGSCAGVSTWQGKGTRVKGKSVEL
jgi:hypothetical protein